MNTIRLLSAALLCALVVPSATRAQEVEIYHSGSSHEIVRVAQDYALARGETVHDIFSVFSPVLIDGTVRGDVTVVVGDMRLGSTAVIDGSLYVIGGSAFVQPGATVRQDVLVFGGRLEAPREFAAGHQHVVIGAAAIGDRLQGLVPWLTEGLLLGRPIVPRLRWVWVVVGIVFLVSLVLCLIFLDTVQTCADKIAARPLTTFLVGLLVLLLAGPVVIVLAASVIGLAVVPFLFCALIIAWIIGKVAVNVRIGDSIVGQSAPASRAQVVRSFVIGFAVMCLAYVLPVLGFVVWALIGVTGLGAATLAFTSAYRRENPTPPKVKSRRGASEGGPPGPAVDLPSPASPLAVPEPPVARITEADPPLPAAGPEPRPVTGGAPGAVAGALAAFPRAVFSERALALVIDVVLVLFTNQAFRITRGDDIPIFLLLAYHIVLWSWKGTTVGGMICHLRVVRVDGRPLRFVDALVRGLSGLVSMVAVGIGFLWVLKDPERQGWHDKIAGTYVVKVPHDYPL
jgi:uncharacterized RDD family membrane protein YckC